MFRKGGIYVLPNGRELMASGDGQTFYATAEDGKKLVRYELNQLGRLMVRGRITAWGQEDLTDSSFTTDVASRLHNDSEPAQTAIE
jgi:hypothetical protein